MNRIKYITGNRKKKPVSYDKLTKTVVYSDDMTHALEIDKEFENKRGIPMCHVKNLRSVTTPVYNAQKTRVVERLWPKGNDFINKILGKNSHIPAYIVPQLFPNVFYGTMKQFEKKIKP